MRSPTKPRRHASSLPARALGALLLAFGAGLGASSAASQEAPEKIATDVAHDLVSRNFGDVVARVSPEMASALPIAALDKNWSDIVRQIGAVRQVENARPALAAPEGVALVVVPVSFERMTLDIRIAIKDAKVAGLFFVPAQAPSVPWNPPAYVDQTKFTSVEVTVGPTALGGTLTVPRSAEKVPALVLIHGSGPNDRDETLGPNRIFRDLAEGLASRGIAVLRYDKRTKVHPEQFAGDSTVREETIDDALAAAALLQARSEIDARRIVILGHSLGGTLAPRIAEGGHGIAAAILLAAASRPLPTIMVEQIEYLASLNGPLDDAARQRIAQIKGDAARALAAKPGDTGPKILDVPPAYWADLNAYDPAVTAAKLSIPLLILQGGRDYQVTSGNLDRFKAALAGHASVTIREFPNLNHMFIAGQGRSRPEEYTVAGHVDSGVVDAVADFVAGLGK